MRSGVRLTGVMNQLRRDLCGEPTDRELVARYFEAGDQRAFADLVQRHGGLVLGVARRHLHDVQQAEDVFQATFLALARAARRLGGQPCLAGWLHTVARRQARRLRRQGVRTTVLEQSQLPRQGPNDPLEEMSAREAMTLLDEELAHLPEVERQPVLLCAVEGLSREEAGRRLGWSEGAVKGRLERGRRRLLERLARRGLTLPSLLAPVAASLVPSELLARVAALARDPWSTSVPIPVAVLAATSTPRRLMFGLLGTATLFLLGVAGLMNVASPRDEDEPALAHVAPGTDGTEPVRDSDPLPPGSVLRLGTDRFRHGTRIDSLVVSADGTLAFAASGNHWLGNTRAYDLRTGRLLYTLKTSSFFVSALALSPDGKILAARDHNIILLFEAATGNPLRKIVIPSTNTSTITSWMTFTPDGTGLAVASSQGQEVLLYDVTEGTVRRMFPHKQTIFAAAFSPHGKFLVAGGYESEGANYFVRLWDVATGKELRTLAAGRGGLRTLAFSPDSSLIAGGDDLGMLRLWETETGKPRATFPVSEGSRVRSVAFSPDGTTIAAAGRLLRLYNIAAEKESAHLDRSLNIISFQNDGKTLISATAGAIHLWDTKTWMAQTPVESAESAVDHLLVNTKAKRILTVDQSGGVSVWDSQRGTHLQRLRVREQHGVALSPDGRYLVWSEEAPKITFRDPVQKNWTHTGSRLRVHDLVTNTLADRFQGFPGDAWNVSFLPGGKELLTTDYRDGTVRVWDFASGRETRTFQVVRKDETFRFHAVRSVRLSPDGKALAVAYDRRDHTTLLFGAVEVRIYDVTTGLEKHQLQGHINQVDDMAFSPDGRLLATVAEHSRGGEGRKTPMDLILIWDTGTGQRLSSHPYGLGMGATRVAFSPDGRLLATTSAEGRVRIWEMASWEVRQEFQGHRDPITALTWSEDGHLLSGSLDTTVLVWDPRPPLSKGEIDLKMEWEVLGNPEARPAYQALGRLRTQPKESVAWLARQVRPALPLDLVKVQSLVTDLDNQDFDRRVKAFQILKTLGRPLAPTLRRALEKTESPEARRRLGQLLAEWEKQSLTSEELQIHRSLELLELLGTEEARRLLEELAQGAPGDSKTEMAKATLARLSRKP